ncbi:hypothetical protein ACE2AJ_16785 [Aquihabitans daechungensis]|uniref:hypothetical protein n=1 Tax=Aquihabitans daechungensis TaxID=1052257 RepID=UPI003B9DF8D8
MADYVPFPDQQLVVETDRSLARKVVGCFGCGGLGVVGFLIAVAVLVGGLAAGAASCDVDLADPGKGTDSQRLPVTVTPSTGLDGSTAVRVQSDAFAAHAIVGVAACLRAADTEQRGVDACDELQGARYATDEAGRLDATYRVPRVITVGGKPYDCAASAQRCLIVAASAADYDESGGQTISFAEDLPAAEMTAVTERAVSDHLPAQTRPLLGTPVPPGSRIEVLATGFQPGEPLLIAHCTPDLEAVGVADACEPVDASAALSAVMMRSVTGDFIRADAQGAITTTVEAEPTVLPIGSDLANLSPALTTTTRAPRGGTTTSVPLREGEVRCTDGAGGCRIVISAAADTKRSAVVPYVVSD